MLWLTVWFPPPRRGGFPTVRKGKSVTVEKDIRIAKRYADARIEKLDRKREKIGPKPIGSIKLAMISEEIDMLEGIKSLLERCERLMKGEELPHR